MSYKKFAKDILLMGITQFFLGLQAFLLLPILTKFLGATDFGIWSQIKITITLLSGFALLGLEVAVIRFMSGQEDKEKISKEFISILLISIVAALVFGSITFIFSDKIGVLLTQVTSSGFFFKFIILMLLLGVIHNLFTTFFRAKENMKLFSAIEITRGVLELMLIYVFLAKDVGLLGVIGAFILAKVIIIFLEFLNVKKVIKLTKPSFQVIKPYLSFSLPLTITPLLWWIIQSGDQYIIGYFIGAKAVGIYALAYSLCWTIRILCDPIFLVLGPSLSRAWNQNDQEAVKVYFKYSYKYLFMIAIPAAFGLSFLAEPILKIISTGEFLGGKILIPIIAVGTAAYVFFQLAANLLILTKKTRRITKFLITFAVINIFLNILLVPFLGPLGAAISTLITFGIAAIVGIKIIRSMGFDLMGKFLLKCLFSSGLMAAAIWFFRNVLFMNEIIKITIIILVSVFLYFSILFLLKGFSGGELKFFKKIVLEPRS